MYYIVLTTNLGYVWYYNRIDDYWSDYLSKDCYFETYEGAKDSQASLQSIWRGNCEIRRNDS